MNAARVAALLRELADALEEGEAPAAPLPARPTKPAKRLPRAQVVPSFPAPVDEVAEMRAKKGKQAAATILRSMGIPVEVPK